MELKQKIRSFCLSLFFIFAICSTALATNWCNDANNKGCWPFEGNANDSSSNGYNGTVNGATNTTTSPPAAYSTAYYVFDNVNDDISFTNWFNFSSTMSGVFWAYNSSDEGNGVYDTYLSHSNSATYPQFEVRFDNGGDSFEVLFSDGTNFSELKSSGIISYGSTWVHWAYCKTWNSTTGAAIYKNGVSQSLSNNQTRTVLSTDLTYRYIGSNNGGSRYIDGGVDEVAFFNDILTSTEVNDIKDNGLLQTTASVRRKALIF